MAVGDSSSGSASNRHQQEAPPTNGATTSTASTLATFDKRRFHDLIKERQMLQQSHSGALHITSITPTPLSQPSSKQLGTSKQSVRRNPPAAEKISPNDEKNRGDNNDGEKHPPRTQAREALIHLAARYKSPPNIIKIKHIDKHNYDAKSLTLTTDDNAPLEKLREGNTDDIPANENDAYNYLAELLSDNEEGEEDDDNDGIGETKEDNKSENSEVKGRSNERNSLSVLETIPNIEQVGRDGRFKMILQMMGENPSERIVQRSQTSISAPDRLNSAESISSGSDMNYLVQLTSMIESDVSSSSQDEEDKSKEVTSSPQYSHALNQRDEKQDRCSKEKATRTCTNDNECTQSCSFIESNKVAKYLDIPLNGDAWRKRWMRHGNMFFMIMLAFFTSLLFCHWKNIISDPIFHWGIHVPSSHDGNDLHADHRRTSPKDHFHSHLPHHKYHQDQRHCYIDGQRNKHRHLRRRVTNNDYRNQNHKQETVRNRNDQNRERQKEESDQHRRRRRKDIDVIQGTKSFFVSMAHRVNQTKEHIPTTPEESSSHKPNISRHNRTKTRANALFKTCVGGIVRTKNRILSATRDSESRQRMVRNVTDLYVKGHVLVNLKDWIAHKGHDGSLMKRIGRGWWEEGKHRHMVSKVQQEWENYLSTWHNMEAAFTERMRDNIKELMEDEVNK